MGSSKNVNFKRVVLIIVEGISDKLALQNVFAKFLSPQKARVYVVASDITSDKAVTPNNVEAKLNAIVSAFLADAKLKRTDIAEIIQITDLDGTFIDDKYVKYDAKCLDPMYHKGGIKTANVIAIRQRNKCKSANIEALLAVSSVCGAKYGLYYVSCNLDHLLHNVYNMDKDDKEEYARRFASELYGKETEFLEYIKGLGALVDGSYEDSWQYAKEGLHSLERKTNLDKRLKQ